MNYFLMTSRDEIPHFHARVGNIIEVRAAMRNREIEHRVAARVIACASSSEHPGDHCGVVNSCCLTHVRSSRFALRIRITRKHVTVSAC